MSVFAYQQIFQLSENDTGFSVSARCVREGLPMLDRLVAQAAENAGAIPRIEQDLSQRSYFVRRRVPHRGRLSWSWSARKLVDLVRAADFHPFPSPWGTPLARRADEPLNIIKTTRTHEPCDAEPGRVTPSETPRAVRVACADEWVDLRLVRFEGGVRAADEIIAAGELLSDG